MSRLILTQITIKKERSISSTTWYYLLQPANASAPDATNYGNPPPIYSNTGYSGWSTTEPTYTIGDNRVLYVMVQTLYSDGTFSYSTPTISSSYEAAKDAYNEVIQAETTIEQFEELGLKKGYIWDNATYVAPSSSVPAYPIGSYIASGILVNGERSITRSNSNTYGLNTWISTGGIKLRYNAIDLMKLTTSNLEFYYPSTSSQQKKAISLGTNGLVNSLAFYGFNSDNKTMELTNSGLSFYNPSDGSTELASFTSDGLVLNKGGIEAGEAGRTDFIYLSTEDYPLREFALTADQTINNEKIYYQFDSNSNQYVEVEEPDVSEINTYYEKIVSGITINDYIPTKGNQSLDTIDDPAWRQIIGAKFGVDSEGNLYASDVNIRGKITATSGEIGGAQIESGRLIIPYSNINFLSTDKISAEHLDLSSKLDTNDGSGGQASWNNGVFTVSSFSSTNQTQYSIEISGTGIKFKYNEVESASIDQDKLVIGKTVVLDEMRVGRDSTTNTEKWTWKVNPSDDAIYLKWLGE